MNRNNAKTIKEAAYNSESYRRGLEYLKRNHPDNWHLKSCFEGVSFRNLARCVLFDRNGKVFNLSGYLKRPHRFVLVSTLGEVTGVMVTASLPEFYQEIEYEDYAAIGAETTSDYRLLLNRLAFTGRAEVVTFNAWQAKIVRSKFSIGEIHCWSIFKYGGQTATGKMAKVRLMNAGDVDLVKRLSKKLPAESSPFRSLLFQLKGFPYENYVLSLNGKTSVFIGVCPYAEGVCQISYLVGLPNSGALRAAAIRAGGEFARASGNELILRMRKKDVMKSGMRIRQSGLVEMTKEKHLHLLCLLRKRKDWRKQRKEINEQRKYRVG